jgi:DNA-binding beta-propeller fold protein YncE
MINSNPIAVDRSGNVFMSSFTNRVRDENATNTILKFDEGIRMSTFVGQSLRGSQDGVGEEATFYGPKGIVYFNRFLFVVDTHNYKIRKISADGTVTTFAGNGTKEIRDGTGTEAGFKVIRCITVDPTGNLYVADDAGTVIRKITPAGVVTTLNIDSSSLDENSEFDEIDYLAADRSGNLYFTSFGSHCIYKITGNTVSILAGNKTTARFRDGTGNEANFNEPTGIVVGRDGNIYVADLNNHRIRKITPAGVVTTLAGDGGDRNTDGVGSEASFNGPMHLAFHPLDAHADILYVVEGDDADLAIRLVDVESGFTGTLFSADDEEEDEEDDFFPQTPPPPPQTPPPAYLTPPENPPSKDIESGSGDVISSDDIEEGSIVGQIVGEGGTIAKSSYYFANSLNNLWSQGLSKFIDPYTRKPIKNVNWYKAHLVPAGSLGGRKKTRKTSVLTTRKVKKSKRTTFRKKRNQIRKLKKSRKQ